MQIVRTFGHLASGTLFIAGTSIGFGLQTLPIAAATGGFIPSIFVYLVCWMFMLFTGLLILETCIWMPKDANWITLSSRLLGRWGKNACWALSLFLFTCLMITYIDAGASAISSLSSDTIPGWLGTLIYVFVFSPIVYFGIFWAERLNLILMIGIAAALLFSISYVSPSQLHRMEWGKMGWALPMILTAFGYQSLIPTLFNYMNRDVHKMRFALILGTAIPLIIYLVWELHILGAISGVFHNPALLTLGTAFTFFAMGSSFLGISLAFVDFLTDGLKLQRKHRKFVCGSIFFIPMLIVLIDPQLFIRAFHIAGGIGTALFFGALPILMVWAGRYHEGYSLTHQQLPGGKTTLSLMLIFVVFEISMMLAS